MFRRILISQAVCLTVFLAVFGISIHFYLKSLFLRGAPTFNEIIEVLFWCFGVALASSLALFIWAGRKYLRPLARLMSRVRALAEGQLASGISTLDLDPEELEEDLPDEVSAIEVSLSKIGRDLVRREERLARNLEELEAVLARISDAVLAVDREGRPLFFNSRFLTELGGSAFAHERPRLRELTRSPEVLEAFSRAIEKAETSTALLASNAYGTSSSLNPEKHYQVSVAPLVRSSTGETYGAIGIFHDITELKQAEMIRIEFVSNVSHELRTPLTSIKGFSETLSNDLATPNWDEALARKQLNAILRNVTRLTDLVNDLLDLSSLESGAELSLERVSTHEITERVLATFSLRMAEKQMKLTTHYGVEALQADPKRIEQVLVNLIDNAVKYVPSGGVIEVTWERAPTGDGAWLRVSDNGPGISAQHLPRLFERFYRVDKTRSRQLGGTGLGLAIVKHIIQRHGGHVEARSTPGVHTEFVCQFPS